jgi:hypothetical protein
MRALIFMLSDFNPEFFSSPYNFSIHLTGITLSFWADLLFYFSGSLDEYGSTHALYGI